MQNSRNMDEKKRKAPEESQSTPPDTLVPGSDVPNKRRKVASNAISSPPSHQLLVHAAEPEASKEVRETRGEEGNEDTPKRAIDADREPTVRSKQKAKVHPPSKTARIIKLAPNRPFPKEQSGPTGPHSSKKEEKNSICVTRRVALGAYLRQCVELVKVDGQVTQFRNAMCHTHGIEVSVRLKYMQCRRRFRMPFCYRHHCPPCSRLVLLISKPK